MVAKYGPVQKIELSLGFAIGQSNKVAPNASQAFDFYEKLTIVKT
jgi:hypothetical protein